MLTRPGIKILPSPSMTVSASLELKFSSIPVILSFSMSIEPFFISFAMILVFFISIVLDSMGSTYVNFYNQYNSYLIN